MLCIVTLSQQDAGGDEGAIAYTLAALKDWTFILGPGWVVGWGNGLILGYLMYRSGLVPPRLAMFGLVGGPLIIISGTLVVFGVFDQGGAGTGARHHPRVHLGAGPRHLRDRLGIQVLLADPEPGRCHRDVMSASQAAPT